MLPAFLPCVGTHCLPPPSSHSSHDDLPYPWQHCNPFALPPVSRVLQALLRYALPLSAPGCASNLPSCPRPSALQALLRYALPIDCKPIRQIQRDLEGISDDLRVPGGCCCCLDVLVSWQGSTALCLEGISDDLPGGCCSCCFGASQQWDEAHRASPMTCACRVGAVLAAAIEAAAWVLHWDPARPGGHFGRPARAGWVLPPL